jgi:glutamate/tyrosine decarboxylase-like PLP-dependent enzyme
LTEAILRFNIAIIDASRSRSFPAKGLAWPELERILLERRCADPPPAEGALDLYWPVIPDAAFHAGRNAQYLYAHLNVFSLPWVDGYREIDGELRAAVAELFAAGSPEQVVITAGGTESNFLAVKAAREWGRARRGVRRPNAVVAETAHPSFDKSGHELGVDVRRVPAADGWCADVEAMARAVDDETVLLVASFPTYPHGVVDDVPALAEVAVARDVWLHVDAAVGGFLAPHVRELDPDLPAFDLGVRGVRSLTADLHKLGFCLTGISTFTLSEPEDLAWPRFSAPDIWPRGSYTRQGFLGSRPAGVVAAAWAVLHTLGREGYREIARAVLAGQQRIAAGVAAIPGLRVVARPRLGLLAIATENEASLGPVVARLAALGWQVETNVRPPSILIFVTPALDVERFLADLAEASRATAADAFADRSGLGAYGAGT